MASCRSVGYFSLWLLLYGGAISLVVLNVKLDAWAKLSIYNKIHTASVLVFISILLVDITEGITQSLVTICFLISCCKGKCKQGDGSDLRCLINYNLLAYAKDDIDDCFACMYRTFMGNLSENVCAVLVSAARDRYLKQYEIACRDKYRTLIFNELFQEGNAFLEENFKTIPIARYESLWEAIEKRYGWWYIHDNLEFICKRLSFEFMCLHRVSRVLKKCGQYQDLMLLNEGQLKAFTYTDRDFYGVYARDGTRDMFHSSEDVRNIFGREYEYTLVMDGDTEIEPGGLHRLLNIAALHPDRTILQPAIEFKVTCSDTLYMNLENVRQKMAAPYHIALSAVFKQCGFFGKGLIHNKSYVEKVIGKPGCPLEKIPINVLSHDTYEAAILKPLYVTTVSLIEKPPYNYLSWNSRLRRWNLGDLILAMHFFCWVGGPMRFLQRCVQCRRYERTRLRTPLTMDFCTMYICSSSIRSMLIKPLWLVYVILHATLPVDIFKYPFIPFIVTIAIVCIMSKVASCLNWPKTILFLIPELLASIFQFTAELFVGSVRLVRVFFALVREQYEWIPQRVVEKEFSALNNVCLIFLQSCKHLWAYTIFGALLTCAIIFTGFAELKLDMRVLLYFNIVAITLLPVFCFVTSLKCPCSCGKNNFSLPSKNVYETSLRELNGRDPEQNGNLGVTLVSARVIGIDMEYPNNAMFKRASRLRQAWSVSKIDDNSSSKLTLYKHPKTMSNQLSLPQPEMTEKEKSDRSDVLPIASHAGLNLNGTNHRNQPPKPIGYCGQSTSDAESVNGNAIAMNKLSAKTDQFARSRVAVNEEETSEIMDQPRPHDYVRQQLPKYANERQQLSKYANERQQLPKYANERQQLPKYANERQQLPKYANASDLFFIPSTTDDTMENKRDLDTIWSDNTVSLTSSVESSDKGSSKDSDPIPDKYITSGKQKPKGFIQYDDILNDLYGSGSLNSTLSSLDGSMFRPKYPPSEKEVDNKSSESWTPTPSITDSQASFYSDEDGQTLHGTYSTEVESFDGDCTLSPAVTLSQSPNKTVDSRPKANHVFFKVIESPKRRSMTESLTDGFSGVSSCSHSDWECIKVEPPWSSETSVVADYSNRWNDTVSLPDDFSSYTDLDNLYEGTATESLGDNMSSTNVTSQNSPKRRRRHSMTIVTSTTSGVESSLEDSEKNDSFFKRLNPMFRSTVPPVAHARIKRGNKLPLTTQTNILNGDGGGTRPHRVDNTQRRLYGKVQKRGRIFRQMYLPPNRIPAVEQQKVESFQLV